MTSLFRKMLLCAVPAGLLTVSPAWGCSCAPIGSNPPCQAAWAVSAVFTGTVTDIAEPSPPSPPPRGGGTTTGRRLANDPTPSLTPRNRLVHMQLGEAFSGVPQESKEIEIVTGLGGGDCGYAFQVGTAYLVYASKNPQGQMVTGICVRTRPLADAAEDLAYLRSIAAAPPTGEIRIVRARLDTKAVSGTHINFEGSSGQYTALTDDAGEARLPGLPAGEYRMHAELEGHLPVDRTVQVHAKGCVEVPLFMAVDRRIQGRVLTKDGLPAANIKVEVRPAKEMSGDSVKTDEEGRYELRRFETGGHYLGINLQQPPSLENPYTRWFYPGTEDPSLAAVIYFSDEAEIKHYDLMLPDRQGERVVQGTVMWPDGRPAAGARLLVLDARWLWQGFVSQAVADANGHFILPRLLDGTHYRLHAALLNPSSYGMMSAEPVDIQPGKTPLDLRLVLIRPGNSVSEDQRKGIEQYRNKQ